MEKVHMAAQQHHATREQQGVKPRMGKIRGFFFLVLFVGSTNLALCLALTGNPGGRRFGWILLAYAISAS
jgi:hypothetical protein